MGADRELCLGVSMHWGLRKVTSFSRESARRPPTPKDLHLDSKLMLGCRLFLLQNDEKKKERTWMTGNIKGNSRGMEVFEGRLVYSIMDNWKTVSPQLSNLSQQTSTLSPQPSALNT